MTGLPLLLPALVTLPASHPELFQSLAREVPLSDRRLQFPNIAGPVISNKRPDRTFSEPEGTAFTLSDAKRRNRLASKGISVRRSRSGGTRSVTTLRR